MTVRVTTSRMWRTLVLAFCFFFSANLALRAASQSKTDWTERALKGERALREGESSMETAGEGGILRLGNESAPFGGADMGIWLKGLGGMGGAVAGPFRVVCWCSHLQEQSVCSLVAVEGADSVLVSSLVGEARDGVTAGELRDMDRRKSM